MKIHIQILLFLLTGIVACSKSTTSRDSSTASPERVAPALLSDSTQTQSAPALIHTLLSTQITTTNLETTSAPVEVTDFPYVDTNAELDVLHLLESSKSNVDTSTFTLTVPDFDFSKSFYLRTPTCLVTATSDSNGIYPKFHCEEGYTQGAWFYVDTGNGYITIQHPTQKDQRWRMYRSTGSCSNATPPVFGNSSSPPTGYASVVIPLLSNAVSYPLTFGRSSGCDNGSTLSYYHLTPTSFTFTGTTSATLLGNAPLTAALAPTLVPSDRSPAQLFLPPCYLSLTPTKAVVDCNAVSNNSRSLFTYQQNPNNQKYYLKSNNGYYLAADGTITANPTPTSLEAIPKAVSSIRYVHVGNGYLTVGAWDGSSATTPVSVGSTGFSFVGEKP